MPSNPDRYSCLASAMQYEAAYDSPPLMAMPLLSVAPAPCCALAHFKQDLHSRMWRNTCNHVPTHAKPDMSEPIYGPSAKQKHGAGRAILNYAVSQQIYKPLVGPPEAQPTECRQHLEWRSALDQAQAEFEQLEVTSVASKYASQARSSIASSIDRRTAVTTNENSTNSRLPVAYCHKPCHGQVLHLL